MGVSHEHEHRKKLYKIREDLNKRVKDVRDHFAKVEKIKVEALKRTEEMRRSAERELAKLEEDIAKSDLVAETKRTLASDIATLKKEIEDRAAELRQRISGIVVPP